MAKCRLYSDLYFIIYRSLSDRCGESGTQTEPFIYKNVLFLLPHLQGYKIFSNISDSVRIQNSHVAE